jgi:hypothetical protein
METLGAGILTFFLITSLGLHIFGLPGNWIILFLTGIWKWFHPEMQGGIFFFSLLFFIALAAEIFEFWVQLWGGKRYGSTGRGNIGGIIGAVIGAVVGAPFFLGIGALFGALAGAFIGSLLTELVEGRNMQESLRSAKGAMFGRFLGMSAKFGLGVVMLWLALPRIWT